MNILWDFDGTLFNTYPAYTDTIYEVLEGQASKQEIMSHLKISFSHMEKHYHLTEVHKTKILELKKNFHPSQTPPFPFLEKVLQSADNNVIMTHKSRKGVTEILSYYGWLDYFQEMVTKEDGFPRKPDPASYIYLHDKYKLDLAIGDRELDILPAKAIGIQTCLFQNNTPGADYYLASYEEFEKIMKLN
ncbi:HAD-IA family hydrolase [Paenibacillus sp. N1-5-1-14]|uniref:HAD-IA family hydrolase n=1 Tax=Paenibacillus radicibacter TaxID=2972488 RepID=UPI0021599968|nr:HAD-IA family hydrolase [Paenibacillus radicibacter]MCR8644485.1 HAD-IA family hydrolase [Paenibacillus radicibacter]